MKRLSRTMPIGALVMLSGILMAAIGNEFFYEPEKPLIIVLGGITFIAGLLTAVSPLFDDN
ncbi:hypothetical protein [Rhizobium sp. LCM 4573]|uniref:hypothetical protein n=1 Tax=Rhizobium sp. LCM 4573 TaxID=1848291 RepID=UPI0008D981D2|nr:hypothetical protein [Rhizobium sp. LCM 4573]OHV78526.1 hypothetical protein LCM4573_26480 [Rhizobium sp. LCM 4573]